MRYATANTVINWRDSTTIAMYVAYALGVALG